ncbi:MAG: hypothetical protein A3H02_00415 [Candidatus Niyogibacteria bacterium RIFCSPLOWO2_12_FULL_41_13]|uniref:DUF192 domain-containing protein n=1 Tax=Candidatus Niyogibacteria bacterium RIFCSPLOWO2_12_FULL_41_13 TaxID=1801726 RepID=A0A1G2F1H5_9BACT|nr:MAG: hypothetical protein A3H02_00415 [Candidatus Niyogibacteria bacterium RIFCSPLOWO2_12_FULL_41_13]
MRFLKYLIVFIVIVGFFAFLSRENEPAFQKIKIGETIISVELADDSPKQTRGLSGKDKLKENNGMLFIYDKPEIRSIWMKDMKFPIDIIWVDENKKIIGVENGVKPESYPKSFESPGPVKYILETNSGFAEKYGLKPGALVDF